MDKRAVQRLARSIIQHVPRGVAPSRTITAPEAGEPIYSMLTESERLAQFALSENVHERKTWPIKGRYLVTS